MIENGNPPRFALLGSGANYSCAVLQSLLDRRYLPELLIIPEYPPSAQHLLVDQQLFDTAPTNRLLSLAENIEVGYAPEARQSDCAQLVSDRKIDYLLVACWPYRIHSTLTASAEKAALNLHPSLLPKHRGPNPIEQQLRCGDSNFGVTLHVLNQHFDQGPIVARAKFEVNDRDLDQAFLERLCATHGVGLFVDACAHGPAAWNLIDQTGAGETR